MANTKTKSNGRPSEPLPWVTDQAECPGIPIWIPSGPPEALLPPDVEPEITLDEMMIGTVAFGQLYYKRSGRYLGVYRHLESGTTVDAYYYARRYLPGGRLPWE